MNTDRGRNPSPDPLPRREDEGPSPGRLIGLGFQFAAAIVLGVLGGEWADRRFNTAPWGVLLGALGGFAAGFHSIYRTAMRETKQTLGNKPGQRPDANGPPDGEGR